MRTLQIRSLSLAALVFLAFAGSASAQDKPPALLNTVEVQQLVKRSEPGDNARLAAHFTALAEQYTAEATRHTSMAQSFVGNPSRSLGTGMSAHCKELADSQYASRPRRYVSWQRTTGNWRLAPQRQRPQRAPASKAAPVRASPPTRSSKRSRPTRAHPPNTALSKRYFRRWRRGTPQTPRSTLPRRAPTGARVSPRPPCIVTTWPNWRGRKPK